MKKIFILLSLIFCLVFTSIIKNKTRSLEKKINNIKNEIAILDSTASEATLDFEYLTTPKNIYGLSKNFLDENFSHYKKSQLYTSTESKRKLSIVDKMEDHKAFDKFDLDKITNKNLYFARNTNIERLSHSEQMSILLIMEKNNNNHVSEEENIIGSKKIQRWAGIQIIKAILGFPIFPK